MGYILQESLSSPRKLQLTSNSTALSVGDILRVSKSVHTTVPGELDSSLDSCNIFIQTFTIQITSVGRSNSYGTNWYSRGKRISKLPKGCRIDKFSDLYLEIDIPGCTDPSYSSYSHLATSHDSTQCINFDYGCSDPKYSNYNPRTEGKTVSNPHESFSSNAYISNDLLVTKHDGYCLPSIKTFNTPGPDGGDWDDAYAEVFAVPITDSFGYYNLVSYASASSANASSLPYWTITDNSGTVTNISGGVVQTNYLLTAGTNTVTVTFTFTDDEGSTISVSDTVIVEVGATSVPGCTDSTAVNFDAYATEDDGSCDELITGCLDDNTYNNAEYPVTLDYAAFNYYEEANTHNQKSCKYYVCTDTTATNYTDISEFPETWGQAFSDDSKCTYDVSLGCMDSTAFNFDPLATTDDGSCYAVLEGCLDVQADNFNNNQILSSSPGLNVNTHVQNTCEYSGCTDATATNTNEVVFAADGGYLGATAVQTNDDYDYTPVISTSYGVGDYAGGGIIVSINAETGEALIITASDYNSGELVNAMGSTDDLPGDIGSPGGFSDWVLPTIEQLSTAWESVGFAATGALLNIANFSYSGYVATECDIKDMLGGAENLNNCDGSGMLRMVRTATLIGAQGTDPSEWITPVGDLIAPVPTNADNSICEYTINIQDNSCIANQNDDTYNGVVETVINTANDRAIITINSSSQLNNLPGTSCLGSVTSTDQDALTETTVITGDLVGGITAVSDYEKFTKERVPVQVIDLDDHILYLGLSGAHNALTSFSLDSLVGPGSVTDSGVDDVKDVSTLQSELATAGWSGSIRTKYEWYFRVVDTRESAELGLTLSSEYLENSVINSHPIFKLFGANGAIESIRAYHIVNGSGDTIDLPVTISDIEAQTSLVSGGINHFPIGYHPDADEDGLIEGSALTTTTSGGAIDCSSDEPVKEKAYIVYKVTLNSTWGTEADCAGLEIDFLEVFQGPVYGCMTQYATDSDHSTIDTTGNGIEDSVQHENYNALANVVADEVPNIEDIENEEDLIAYAAAGGCYHYACTDPSYLEYDSSDTAIDPSNFGEIIPEVGESWGGGTIYKVSEIPEYISGTSETTYDVFITTTNFTENPAGASTFNLSSANGLADTYEGGEYNDWYLPDLLEFMVSNEILFNEGASYSDGIYWVSGSPTASGYTLPSVSSGELTSSTEDATSLHKVVLHRREVVTAGGASSILCNTISIEGCTDVNANNYDEAATIDNDSCIYEADYNYEGCRYPSSSVNTSLSNYLWFAEGTINSNGTVVGTGCFADMYLPYTQENHSTSNGGFTASTSYDKVNANLIEHCQVIGVDSMVLNLSSDEDSTITYRIPPNTICSTEGCLDGLGQIYGGTIDSFTSQLNIDGFGGQMETESIAYFFRISSDLTYAVNPATNEPYTSADVLGALPEGVISVQNMVGTAYVVGYESNLDLLKIGSINGSQYDDDDYPDGYVLSDTCGTTSKAVAYYIYKVNMQAGKCPTIDLSKFFVEENPEILGCTDEDAVNFDHVATTLLPGSCLYDFGDETASDTSVVVITEDVGTSETIGCQQSWSIDITSLTEVPGASGTITITIEEEMGNEVFEEIGTTGEIDPCAEDTVTENGTNVIEELSMNLLYSGTNTDLPEGEVTLHAGTYYSNIHRSGRYRIVATVTQSYNHVTYTSTYYSIIITANNIIDGCMSPCAYNYNPSATCDDGSCIDAVYGCMQEIGVTNYNSDATVQQVSCEDTSNPCIAIVEGCTDTLAPGATALDNIVNNPAFVEGVGAYNPEANLNDGSCIYCPDSLEDFTVDQSLSGNTYSLTYPILSGEGEMGDGTYSNVITAITDISQYGGVTFLAIGGTPGAGVTVTLDAVNESGLPLSFVKVNYIFNNGLCHSSFLLTESDLITITPVEGCMDSSALNYNENANYQTDTDCTPVIEGCTDPLAENYNDYDGDGVANDLTNDVFVDVNTDDGSCEYIEGCTDELAFNYDALATLDDDSCVPVVTGCMDDTANNTGTAITTDLALGHDVNTQSEGDDYNCTFTSTCSDETADNTFPELDYGVYSTSNNTTCEYTGCMDPAADNFDVNANMTGDCTYSGCTEETAFNYDPSANTDDGSCIETVLGCTDSTMFGYDPLANTDDDSCAAVVDGCTDATAFNFNSLANTDDGSCVDIVYGCTDSTAFNYNSLANVDDDSCIATVVGCTNSTMFNYDANANLACNDGVENDCCVSVLDGCTNSSAENYNTPTGANTDDGTCCLLVDDLGYSLAGTNNADPTQGPFENMLTVAWNCTGPTYGATISVNPLFTTNEYFTTEAHLQGSTLTITSYDSADTLIETASATADDMEDGTTPTVFVDGYASGNQMSYLIASASYQDENGDHNCLFSGQITVPTTDGSGNSCVVTAGCTDNEFVEYNPLANDDDGSCSTPIVYGCTDVLYLEYEATATTNETSLFDSTSPCVNLIVNGCTDVDAFNYNAAANTDDSSCYDVVLGCTDSNAANYNDYDYDGQANALTGTNGVDVNTDNGSCCYTSFTYLPVSSGVDGSIIRSGATKNCTTREITFNFPTLAQLEVSENAAVRESAEFLERLSSFSIYIKDALDQTISSSTGLSWDAVSGLNSVILPIEDADVFTDENGVIDLTLGGHVGDITVSTVNVATTLSATPANNGYIQFSYSYKDDNATPCADEIAETFVFDESMFCSIIFGCLDTAYTQYNGSAIMHDPSMCVQEAVFGCATGSHLNYCVGSNGVGTVQYGEDMCFADFITEADNLSASGSTAALTALLDNSCVNASVSDSIAAGAFVDTLDSYITCWSETTPCIVEVSGCLDETYLEYGDVADANVHDQSLCLTLIVEGCTDDNYVEYEATANVDDGSCSTVVIEGCTNANYIEYDSAANTDDGSCVNLIVEGCTDSNYLEYNAQANQEDGSCAILEVEGCTDAAYTEFWDITDFVAVAPSPVPNSDDGSCNTLIIAGCKDEMYLQYSEEANVSNDDMCIDIIVSGCTDDTAFNYNVNANVEDDSCVPILYGCTNSESFNYNADANTDDGTCEGVVYGCTDPEAFNYNELANTDNGTCKPTVEGCMDETATNYDALANEDDGSCIYPVDGCTDNTAFNFDPLATNDDGSCIDVIVGCTDDTANNYNVEANTEADPSSCTYDSGCMDEEAINYDSIATINDGSCVYCPEESLIDQINIITTPTTTDASEDGSVLIEGVDIISDYYTSGVYGGLSWYIEEDDGSWTSIGVGVALIEDLAVGNYKVVIAGMASPYNECEYTKLFTITTTGLGCTDPLADDGSYDVEAIEDDGSCEYSGCTDPIADNFDETATIDDASCTYTTGCMDDTACNYVADASVASECLYAADYRDCNGNCINEAPVQDNGDPYPGFEGLCAEEVEIDCTDVNAINFRQVSNSTVANRSAGTVSYRSSKAAETTPILHTDNGMCVYNNECVPDDIVDILDALNNTLVDHSKSVLTKMRTGMLTASDTENLWKLMLIDYLVSKIGTEGIYNCNDYSNKGSISYGGENYLDKFLIFAYKLGDEHFSKVKDARSKAYLKNNKNRQ